jgi:hypothetical protein
VQGANGSRLHLIYIQHQNRLHSFQETTKRTLQGIAAVNRQHRFYRTRPFTLQKAINYAAKYGLLQGERPPFANALAVKQLASAFRA